MRTAMWPPGLDVSCPLELEINQITGFAAEFYPHKVYGNSAAPVLVGVVLFFDLGKGRSHCAVLHDFELEQIHSLLADNGEVDAPFACRLLDARVHARAKKVHEDGSGEIGFVL